MKLRRLYTTDSNHVFYLKNNQKDESDEIKVAATKKNLIECINNDEDIDLSISELKKMNVSVLKNIAFDYINI